MRQEYNGNFTRERENENHSLERRSNMQLAKYVLIPTQGMWHNYVKDYSNFQAYGESFEELQL